MSTNGANSISLLRLLKKMHNETLDHTTSMSHSLLDAMRLAGLVGDEADEADELNDTSDLDDEDTTCCGGKCRG